MKINYRKWRWTIPALAALTWYSPAAFAQQPLSSVELAQPIAAEPAAGQPAGEEESEEPAGKESPGAVPAPPTAAEESAAPSAQESADTGDEADPTPPSDAAEPAPLPTSDVIELIKERYAGGAVKIEREMVQDLDGNYMLHGAWRHFDEQGRLMIDGRNDHGQKVGLWRKFYRGTDAQLLGTSPYKDFTAPFISQANFHSGTMHGKWTITDSKQRKVHEIEFCDGQRHGKATWYYPNGAIMLQAQYERGRVNGDVTKFAPDTSVLAQETYLSGRKLAPKTEYYDAEKKIKKQETTYLHALLVVKTTDNWDTCTLATFENRGADERHGPFTAWHRNGQPARQGEYRYNLPVGKISYWFDNGQKQIDGMYVDGRQEGVWTWWHANGQKAITGEYHDANPVGQWAWWQANGKVAQRSDLSSGGRAPLQTPEARSESREAKLQNFELGLPLR